MATSKSKMKLIAFIFSQISILLFGSLVGCWVTVGMRTEELAVGDPQIVLVKDLGITFTVFFVLCFIVTIICYGIYKDNANVNKMLKMMKINPNIENNNKKVVNKKVTTIQESRRVVAPSVVPVQTVAQKPVMITATKTEFKNQPVVNKVPFTNVVPTKTVVNKIVTKPAVKPEVNKVSKTVTTKTVTTNTNVKPTNANNVAATNLKAAPIKQTVVTEVKKAPVKPTVQAKPNLAK